MSRYCCVDCGVSPYVNEGPMLHDSIWFSIAEEKEYLCYTCIEKRLGRPIQIDDLRQCNMNQKFIKYLQKRV